MSEKFLDEFSNPTYEDWLKLVDTQLKGVPFEKKLVKELFTGISVKPLYRQSDNQELQSHSNPSGQFPFVRGFQASGHTANAWEITQQWRYPTVDQFNEAACHDIPRGLSRLSINLDSAGKSGQDPDPKLVGLIGKDGLSAFCVADMATLFSNINLPDLCLQIEGGLAAVPFLSLIVAHLQTKQIPTASLKGTLVFDPLALLAEFGKLDRSIADIYREMAGLIQWTGKSAPSLKALGIDLQPYYESGGNAVQELAFAMATGAEYIRNLTDLGCEIDQIAHNIQFLFSIGSDFFTEIAKFRAIRSLWAQVIKAFGGETAAQKTSLQGHSSKRNKTVNDPHVNILRTTTEAFSGVIGGCDIISVAPFDETTGLPDDFSRRVARNIQIILREECHGHKTIDPSGGSWYVENLTDQLARSAWLLFQKIEKNGGMLQSLQDGIVQEKVTENKRQIKQRVSLRKQVIVGTNLYVDIEEKNPQFNYPDYESIGKQRSQYLKSFRESRTPTPDLTKIKDPSLKSDPPGSDMINAAIAAASNNATLGEIYSTMVDQKAMELTITPLEIRRDSEDFEKLRKRALAFENRTGNAPFVYLANMGPAQQHKARVDFSIDFLKPGGFSTITGKGFDTSMEAAKAALDSKAKIVVICSTDDSYPELVPDITQAIKKEKPETLVLVAGYPKDHVDSFKKQGVDNFIHLKADNLEILNMLQKQVGIES